MKTAMLPASIAPSAGRLLFRMLLVLAWLLIVPQLALGILLTTPVLTKPLGHGTLIPQLQLLVIYVCTGLGIAGLIRSRLHKSRSKPAGIEKTQYFVLIGFVTAANVVAYIAHPAFLSPFSLSATMIPLAILIADGVMQIGRLDRMRITLSRSSSNVVPLALLGMGLWLTSRLFVTVTL